MAKNDVDLLAPTTEQQSEAGQIFDQDKLPKLADWSAGGFAALAALLTFFGVKDGLLTRILNEAPTESLWVLVTVGAGVVLAAFALAVKATQYLKVWLVTVAVALVALVTSMLLKDFNESALPGMMLWVAVAVLVVFTLMAFFKRWTMPMAAALIVLATACTASGLYSATKISVEAKAAPESMRVRAQLTGEGHARTLEISLAGSKQRDGVVLVIGSPRLPTDTKAPKPSSAGETGAVQLWRSFFSADENRAVSEKFTVPVETGQWSRIAVLSCVNERSADQCTPKERYTFVGGRTLTPASVTGTLALKAGGKRLVAAVTASGLLNSEYVRVWVEPMGSANAVRLGTAARQTLGPDAEGAASWSDTFPRSSTPTVKAWRLRTVVCESGKPCSRAGSTVQARYRPPA